MTTTSEFNSAWDRLLVRNGIRKTTQKLGDSLNAIGGSFLSAVPSGGTAFAFNTSTNYTGGKLLSVQNNGVEKAYFDQVGDLILNGSLYSSGILNCSGVAAIPTSSTGLLGQVATSGTAVAITLDNSASLTTAGDKLVSIRNNTTEKAFVGKDGEVGVGGIAALPTASATYRGALWVVQGGGGVADVCYVCLKAAAGTYSWKTISTG